MNPLFIQWMRGKEKKKIFSRDLGAKIIDFPKKIWIQLYVCTVNMLNRICYTNRNYEEIIPFYSTIERRNEVKYLYMKQKVMSLRGRFTVVDEQQQDQYFVEGTFLQIPKRFSIITPSHDEVATITKKVFSWLPTFLWRLKVEKC